MTIASHELKIGMVVKCCSQKGKCLLIAPIEFIDRINRQIHVTDRLGHKKTYPFDRLKPL